MRVAISRAFEISESSGISPDARMPALALAGDDNDPAFPLTWWRTKTPGEFRKKDAAILRWALMGTRISGESHWPDVVTGEVPAAIKVAVERLKKRKIDHVEIDLALSAMLAFAIDGDVTSGILISSALRRRSKIDPPCRLLSDLWLIADFWSPGSMP